MSNSAFSQPLLNSNLNNGSDSVTLVDFQRHIHTFSMAKKLTLEIRISFENKTGLTLTCGR